MSLITIIIALSVLVCILILFLVSLRQENGYFREEIARLHGSIIFQDKAMKAGAIVAKSQKFRQEEIDEKITDRNFFD